MIPKTFTTSVKSGTTFDKRGTTLSKTGTYQLSDICIVTCEPWPLSVGDMNIFALGVDEETGDARHLRVMVL